MQRRRDVKPAKLKTKSKFEVADAAATPFTFIDLFAGLGGFHLALDSLGGHCVMACEIDEDCQRVYHERFPKTPLVGDIRSVSDDPLKKVPAHDVLCAGFPCQPFSKSGFQLGLRDKTRGTLFFDIMEIVRAHHPRFVILENVRNIAGPRHRDTWRVVIDSLREEGYRVDEEPTVFSPHLLPAELGGRPQIRERVYILAERVSSRPIPALLTDRALVQNTPIDGWSPMGWRIEDWLQEDDEIGNLVRYSLRPEEVRWIEAWQQFIQNLDEEPLPGFPIWVDAFVESPEISLDTPSWKADFLIKNSALYVRNRSMIDDWMEHSGVRDFPQSRRKFEWQARGFDRDLWKLVLHLRPSGIRVKGPTYLPALVAITQTSIIGARRRRITPREAARLQGIPDDYILHPDDKVAYKQLGNGVSAGVVRHLAKLLFDSAEFGWPGAAEAPTRAAAV